MSNSITQDIQYKQTVVEYSYRHGVTKAAIKFKMYRKTIYRWRERYDGTAKSLKEKSRRPHSNPNQHTEQEIKEQDGRYYQYTAIDEYTRKRVLWASKEHSTYASEEFLKIIIKKFPFKREKVTSFI